MPISGARILCVEDNRDARDMLTALLSTADQGYSVTAVETAAEALDLDGRAPFDLYVLDISLPGMDGVDLCRRLRGRGRTQPIIFFSAIVQPRDPQFVLDAGANDFLVKPLDIDRFTGTVERLLDEHFY